MENIFGKSNLYSKGFALTQAYKDFKERKDQEPATVQRECAPLGNCEEVDIVMISGKSVDALGSAPETEEMETPEKGFSDITKDLLDKMRDEIWKFKHRNKTTNTTTSTNTTDTTKTTNTTTTTDTTNTTNSTTTTVTTDPTPNPEPNPDPNPDLDPDPKGGNFELFRGENATRTFNSATTVLTLKNPFDNKEYKYQISSLSGNQEATFEFLENGRLVVRGDYLKILSYEGQKDDFIVLGNNNDIQTGDKEDIVRLGGVEDDDKKYYYVEGGVYGNSVSTGAGNDYVVMNEGINILECAKMNVDLGSGADDKYLLTSYEEAHYDDWSRKTFSDFYKFVVPQIKNAEQLRYNNYLEGDNDGVKIDSRDPSVYPVNNKEGWTRLLNTNVDTRFLSMINSYGKNSNTGNLKELFNIETEPYTTVWFWYKDGETVVSQEEDSLNRYWETRTYDGIVIPHAWYNGIIAGWQMTFGNNTKGSVNDGAKLDVGAGETYGAKFGIYGDVDVLLAYFNLDALIYANNHPSYSYDNNRRDYGFTETSYFTASYNTLSKILNGNGDVTYISNGDIEVFDRDAENRDDPDGVYTNVDELKEKFFKIWQLKKENKISDLKFEYNGHIYTITSMDDDGNLTYIDSYDNSTDNYYNVDKLSRLGAKLIYNTGDFKTKFLETWEKYNAGKISNLMIDISGESDYSKGVIASTTKYNNTYETDENGYIFEEIQRATSYSVKNVGTNSKGELYVELVNPIDDADILRLEFDDLMEFNVSFVVYGEDLYNQDMMVLADGTVTPKVHN